MAQMHIKANINYFIIGIAVLFTACGNTESSKPTIQQSAPPAQSVEALVVFTTDLSSTIEATGTIIANEEVEIRSEIQGRVSGVFFKEGETVQSGKLLIKIDDSELLAELKHLELAIKLAADDETRKKKLTEIGGISKEDYDVSINYLQQLEAERDLLNTQIAKTKIFAPFTGIIGLRYISEGGFVTPLNLIATLQQTNPIKVEFSVPEKYAGSIQNGAMVKYKVIGDNNTYTATIYAKEPKIDPTTRTIKVRATGPNNNNSIMPGAFAKLEIGLATEKDAIVLPSNALIPTINGQSVMLVKNGKASMQVVLTGDRTASTTQIVEGITAGDTVIVTGLLTLRDGMPVKPIITSNNTTN